MKAAVVTMFSVCLSDGVSLSAEAGLGPAALRLPGAGVTGGATVPGSRISQLAFQGALGFVPLPFLLVCLELGMVAMASHRLSLCQLLSSSLLPVTSESPPITSPK